MKALKAVLSLVHYGPNKEIYVETEASNLGLCAVLLHKKNNRRLKQ